MISRDFLGDCAKGSVHASITAHFFGLLTSGGVTPMFRHIRRIPFTTRGCVLWKKRKKQKKKVTMASTQSCTMCTTCSCCKPWMIASRTAVPMSGAAHPPSGAVLRSRTCAVTRLLSFPHLQMRLLVLLPRLLGLPLQQWKRPFRSTRCPLHSFRPSFCFVLLISLR